LAATIFINGTTDATDGRKVIALALGKSKFSAFYQAALRAIAHTV
jgi:hypothetical protein